MSGRARLNEIEDAFRHDGTGRAGMLRESIDIARRALARAEKAEVEAKNTRTLYDALLDERARSFAMLAKVVGKVGCTEYQAEVDLEIASRIEAIKAEVESLRRACDAAHKALLSYQFGNRSPDLAEEVAAVCIAALRGEEAKDDKASG